MLRDNMTKESMQHQREPGAAAGKLVLGVDTCGPSGSVALARMARAEWRILEQIELAGTSYSATLVRRWADLLTRAGATVAQLRCNCGDERAGELYRGPGGAERSEGSGGAERDSGGCGFATGGAGGRKAGVEAAALDAHRHEVFLRLMGEGDEVREILAGRGGSWRRSSRPGRALAVCDDAAAEVLTAAWPEAELVRVAAPMACRCGSSWPRRRFGRGILSIWPCWMGIICGGRMRRFSESRPNGGWVREVEIQSGWESLRSGSCRWRSLKDWSTRRWARRGLRGRHLDR